MQCKVPECKATIYAKSTTGVCRHHGHEQGYCTCKQCKERGKTYMKPLTPKQRAERKKKHKEAREFTKEVRKKETKVADNPNIVRVSVRRTSLNSLYPVRQDISLPRAPWEQPNG